MLCGHQVKCVLIGMGGKLATQVWKDFEQRWDTLATSSAVATWYM